MFDYINAEIPVLVSNLPEMEQIIKTYELNQFNNKNEFIFQAESSGIYFLNFVIDDNKITYKVVKTH